MRFHHGACAVTGGRMYRTDVQEAACSCKTDLQLTGAPSTLPERYCTGSCIHLRSRTRLSAMPAASSPRSCLRPFVRILRLVGMLMLGSTLCAQAQSPWETPPTDTRWARDTTLVVEMLTLPADTRQLVIEGPADAAILDVTLLRYGAAPVDFEAEQRPTAWTLRFSTPQQGPFEAVMRVHTGASTPRAVWRLIPFIGANATPAPLTRIEKAIEAPPSGRATWGWRPPAASAAPQAAPRTENGPLAAGQRPGDFTVAFWMRTLRRDAVIASTWTGVDEAPYPLEIVTGPAGRLLVYQGSGTAHHAVRTEALVADGRWHHVAVRYARATRTTTVYVNGAVVSEARKPVREAASAALTFGRRPASPPEAASAPADSPTLFAWVQVIAGALAEPAIRSLRTAATPHPQARPYGAWPPAGALANDGASVGAAAVRVMLPLEPAAPVANWQARVQGAEVTLGWTATHDTGRYVVERSTDRTRWTAFATRTPASGTRLPSGARQHAVVDASPPGDVVFYRVRWERPAASDQVSQVLKVGRGARPEEEAGPRLIGNFPNPFATQTTIAFELPEAAAVTLRVWTLDGRPAEEVAARTFPAGYHEVPFQNEALPSGTYFLRFEAGAHTAAHRMVVVR